MGVRITENFIRETEALRKCLLYKDVTWEITKKDDYNDWGDKTHPENSFDIHLKEADQAESSCFDKPNCFGEKGQDIIWMEVGNLEVKQRAYLEKAHPELDFTEDELDWSPYISDSMNAKLEMDAMMQTYVDIAEKVVAYIRQQFDLGKAVISVYAKNELLIESDPANSEKGETDPMKDFRRFKTILEQRCAEYEGCAVKCYEGFAGKDLEYYGEMKNLVLLGKLQLLDQQLPENLSEYEITEGDGKTTLTMNHGDKVLSWDYTTNKYDTLQMN